MEYTEEDLYISNENNIIRQKEFVLTSDKKNVFNAKLYFTTNDLFCLDLETNIDFQTKKYSIALTMNELIKDRFFKIFIDLDEVFRELESKIENSNIMEDTNQIYLDIPIGLNVINDIILEIKESKKTNEQIITDLTNQLNNKDNLLKQKDNQINQLEAKLKENQINFDNQIKLINNEVVKYIVENDKQDLENNEIVNLICENIIEIEFETKEDNQKIKIMNNNNNFKVEKYNFIK